MEKLLIIEENKAEPCATWTHDTANSELPQEKLPPEDEYKPNRHARRHTQRAVFRILSHNRPRETYACGICGLSFVAPTESRCRCKVSKPRYAARNPMEELDEVA